MSSRHSRPFPPGPERVVAQVLDLVRHDWPAAALGTPWLERTAFLREEQWGTTSVTLGIQGAAITSLGMALWRGEDADDVHSAAMGVIEQLVHELGQPHELLTNDPAVGVIASWHLDERIVMVKTQPTKFPPLWTTAVRPAALIDIALIGSQNERKQHHRGPQITSGAG